MVYNFLDLSNILNFAPYLAVICNHLPNTCDCPPLNISEDYFNSTNINYFPLMLLNFLWF